MNQLILILSVFLIGLQSEAFSLSSQIAVNTSGELTKTLNLQCESRDILCEETCGHPSLCQIPETFCEDCATASSAILHTVFTDIDKVFKSEFAAIDQAQFSQFFKTKKFLTLAHDSFLNLFTPEKKLEIKAQFESLCYIQNVRSSMLLTTLTEENQVDQLVGVICQDQKGQSVILPIQFNPLFSNKGINFWSNPNDAPLKLKMAEELGKP
jgi:hypothetical protein